MSTERVLHCAGWLTLSVPEGWIVERDEDCLSLFRRDGGVGVLQLSTYHRDTWEADPVTAAQNLLEEVVQTHAVAPEGAQLRQGTQHGAAMVYSEFSGPGPERSNGDLWRVWCFADGAKVILVSYLCDPGFAYREAMEVENIVSSIRLTLD
jgi:hypothetical protein